MLRIPLYQTVQAVQSLPAHLAGFDAPGEGPLGRQMPCCLGADQIEGPWLELERFKLSESVPSYERDLQATDVLFLVASSSQRIREGAGSSRVPAAAASWSVGRRAWQQKPSKCTRMAGIGSCRTLMITSKTLRGKSGQAGAAVSTGILPRICADNVVLEGASPELQTCCRHMGQLARLQAGQF